MILFYKQVDLYEKERHKHTAELIDTQKIIRMKTSLHNFFHDLLRILNTHIKCSCTSENKENGCFHDTNDTHATAMEKYKNASIEYLLNIGVIKSVASSGYIARFS